MRHLLDDFDRLPYRVRYAYVVACMGLRWARDRILRKPRKPFALRWQFEAAYRVKDQCVNLARLMDCDGAEGAGDRFGYIEDAPTFRVWSEKEPMRG